MFSPTRPPQEQPILVQSRFLTQVISLALLAVVFIMPTLAWAEAGHGEHAAAHPLPPLWTTVFFVIMLLSIAILPLTSLHHWWENNLNKLLVGLALAAYPLVYLTVVEPNWHALEETLHEYISFIVLLGTLFYVSGGILLKGDLNANPRTNLAFLAFGTAIASFVGTTGASMLLIRPLLRTNHERHYKVHIVVFFIFLVSNIGGSLLPIGDPPLFLGYLQGVPFTWTLGLWPQMLVVVTILLTVFYFMDRHFYQRESPAVRAWDATSVEPLRIEGTLNIVWLAGIVLCVALISPQWPFAREAAMIACALGSHFTTPASVREANQFSWFPILEVAALFIGIFLTMIPALEILKANGGQLGVDSPLKFFWVTGGLSSFLDNAPTYLVFFNTARGMVEQGMLASPAMVESVGIPTTVLQAISVGAVFMGANTYIGNGPNFMVKAIAEEQRVEMPSFFGYIRWSGALLIPTFVIVSLIFFVF